MERMASMRPLNWDFVLEAPERNRAWYEEQGYEPYSVALFSAACRRSTVVVDVGAHVGFYSLVASEVNRAARIIAVEASPFNAEVIARNIGRVPGRSVEVVNAALTDTSGTVAVHFAEASDNNSLAGSPYSPVVEVVEVRAMRGDELRIEPGSRLTIKIDVEGSELAVLRGLETVIDSAKTVALFVEFNPRTVEFAGGDPQDLLNWIFAKGMRAFALDDLLLSWRELTPDRPWQEVVDPAGYVNLYCAPRDAIVTVASVMHSAGLGGAEHAQIEASADLVARGHLVHAVLPEPDGGSAALWRAAGSSVTFVPSFTWWMLPESEAAGSPASWVEGLADSGVIDSLRAVRPDVVMTSTGVVAQGAIAAAALGIPHVWYLREFGDLDHGLTLPVSLGKFGAVVLGLSDVVIANSAAIRAHLFPDAEDAARVEVIFAAPALHGLRIARPAGSPWSVGVVASFNPGKGHQDALEAVALLRREGLDVPLVLPGTGSPHDVARLFDSARDLGIADLVTMPGVFGDMSELYSLFDVVAVTSRAEAFGRVPFEATEAGVPIIYAAAGGVVEYMTPGVTGLDYQPGDSRSLAAAIRLLSESPDVRTDLVGRARAELLDPATRSARFEAMAAAVLRARDRGPLDADRRAIGALARSAFSSVGAAGDAAARVDQLAAALAALETDNRALHTAHQQLSQEHGRVVLGNLGLAEAHSALRLEHDALVIDSADLHAANKALLDENSASMAAAQARALELARLRAVESEFGRVALSHSWRYTAPLRTLWRRLRRS